MSRASRRVPTGSERPRARHRRDDTRGRETIDELREATGNEKLHWDAAQANPAEHPVGDRELPGREQLESLAGGRVRAD